MVEDTNKAQLEVASAYAAQRAGNGANWCIRYEVANKGPDAVPLLNWPLAGLKFEDLTIADGPQSNVLTLQPGFAPTVKDTVPYGFKSQTIRTKAFQSADVSTKPSLITLVASNDDAGSGSSSSLHRANQTFALEKGERLPEVGGEFNGAGADIGITSAVTRDNDVYHFTFQLGRNDSKSVQSVVAPLTLAFAKLGNEVLGGHLEAVIKGVGSSELDLPNDTFDVRMDLSVASVPRIYVVFQPITFRNINKSKLCFLVPTYSPINIQENWLSCP
jgi:hypothetical protein